MDLQEQDFTDYIVTPHFTLSEDKVRFDDPVNDTNGWRANNWGHQPLTHEHAVIIHQRMERDGVVFGQDMIVDERVRSLTIKYPNYILMPGQSSAVFWISTLDGRFSVASTALAKNTETMQMLENLAQVREESQFTQEMKHWFRVLQIPVDTHQYGLRIRLKNATLGEPGLDYLDVDLEFRISWRSLRDGAQNIHDAFTYGYSGESTKIAKSAASAMQ